MKMHYEEPPRDKGVSLVSSSLLMILQSLSLEIMVVSLSLDLKYHHLAQAEEGEE